MGSEFKVRDVSQTSVREAAVEREAASRAPRGNPQPEEEEEEELFLSAPARQETP